MWQHVWRFVHTVLQLDDGTGDGRDGAGILRPPILGPFYLNYTPGLLRAMKNMPIVRTEPTAQHMYDIYLHFGLTRLTSLLFIPMVALFAGIATAFLHCLDRRARIFLVAPLVWSLTLMARDLYTILFLHYQGVKLWRQIIPVALKEPSLWVPIPLFVAVIVCELLRRTSLRRIGSMSSVGVFLGCARMLSGMLRPGRYGWPLRRG